MIDDDTVDEPLLTVDDADLLLPCGWADALLTRAATDSADEPNVLRGLD